MEERNMPRRPRREKADDQPRNESLVYGKNPVTELLKSGSGVDTVLLAEGMAPAVAAYYTAMAKEVGAAVKRVNPNKLRLMTGTDSHQGVAAISLMPGQLWRVTRLYIQRASVPTAKDTRDACMGSPKKRRKRLLMPACTGMHPPPTTARRSSRLFMLAPGAVYE